MSRRAGAGGPGARSAWAERSRLRREAAANAITEAAAATSRPTLAAEAAAPTRPPPPSATASPTPSLPSKLPTPSRSQPAGSPALGSGEDSPSQAILKARNAQLQAHVERLEASLGTLLVTAVRTETERLRANIAELEAEIDADMEAWDEGDAAPLVAKKTQSALLEDGALPAPLDHPKAQDAPTRPGAPPGQRAGSPRPPQPASGRSKS